MLEKINFEHHIEIIQLDVITMLKYDIILGMLQFEQHNLNIDQIDKRIDFPRYNCAQDLEGQKYLPAPNYDPKGWAKRTNQPLHKTKKIQKLYQQKRNNFS